MDAPSPSLLRRLLALAPRLGGFSVLMPVVCLALIAPPAAHAQETIRISGDRLSGFVLPIEPIAGDITFESLRAWSWSVDDTKRLVLSGDVRIAIGGFRFSGPEAVIWINRLPSADGLINQIAVYFDEVTDSGKRAGLGANGARLLITGSARGNVALDTALLDDRRPGGLAILTRGEARLAEHLRRLAAGAPPLERRPNVDAVAPPRSPAVEVGRSPAQTAAQVRDTLPTTIDVPGRADEARLPLFLPDGTFSFTAREIDVIEGPEENAVIAGGSFVVEYVDDRGQESWSRLTLSAERGVVFTDPMPIEEMLRGMNSDSVHGVYLEGNVVASDGRYTIRGERIYYDVRNNRAIMLDAVLRTYSRVITRPVYARASEMRQIAHNEWTAERATISASEFFTPHLAIGAREVTVTERPTADDPDQTETYFVSRDNTLRLGGMPVLWWPRLSGTVEAIPLRRLNIGYSESDGVEIESTWNLFALLGRLPPDGLDAELRLDGYTKRGAGVGLRFEYDFTDSEGMIDLYGLYDDGTDRTGAGLDVEQDDEFRGYALWENRIRLGATTELLGQVSWISDETFMATWRDRDFEERRPYETSLYYRDVSERLAFTGLLSYDLNDFISTSYELGSRQHSVHRVPEVAYRRFQDELFGGDLRWSSEYRVSRMRFNFERHSPRQLGIRHQGFGLGPDDRFIDGFRAAGFPSEYVSRFDTRHEFTLPMRWGAFNVEPFLVGRFTAYDNDFDRFSSDAEDMRYFGAAGLRVSAAFQHIDNAVDHRLLDLHRLRHIIEPSMMLWYGWSNVSQGDLPVYDEEIESIGTGSVVRLGLRNTWQTQRGGPGRWRSVDVFTLDTALVLNSDDRNRESPVPQFFEYRPELSQFGDHVSASALWELSDTLALVGEGIYDLDDDHLARGSVGAELRHSPLFTTYIEYRRIKASDSSLLDVGWYYRMTPKYAMSVTPQWDFREDKFRSIRLRFVRSFPDFDLVFGIRYDDIRDETEFTATLGRVNF